MVLKKNDINAVKALYIDGIWWSLLVARKYVSSKAKIETLVMCGFEGWLQAIELYRLNYTFKFNVYATWWIKEKIELYLNNLDNSHDS